MNLSTKELEKNPFSNNIIISYTKSNKEKLINYITEREQAKTAIKEFLNELKITCFLIESPYIDKDYLEDYSNYYARSFKEHGRFCERIHFFSKKSAFKLDTQKFNEIILNGKSFFKDYDLNEDYMGFITLRPVSIKKRIAKTCLKNYKNDKKRNRQYTAVRKYNVNLYGIPLTVDSMAFQEQDEAVALCASIALWSAFQITGTHNQHKIPSPSIVTKLALSESSYIKDFPSIGLTIEQIAVAVNKVGISPVIRQIRNARELKQYIYAYLKAEIPIVCGISLFDLKKDKKTIIASSKSFHAITINGFSFENGKTEIPFGKNGLKLYASSMTKFFAHDDQLCPFARINFENQKFYEVDNGSHRLMSTTWTSSDKKADKYKVAKIETIIIPSNHKIRISYQEVLNKIKKYNKYIKSYLDEFSKNIEPNKKIDLIFDTNLEWEIFLLNVNQMKKYLRKNKFISESTKKELLFKDYPRHLWIASAKNNQNEKFDLIFDATESKITYLKEYIIYDKELNNTKKLQLQTILKNDFTIFN